MIPIKTESEIQSMREAGGVASLVLRQVAARVEAGIATRDLDRFAAERIRELGAESAFLGYHGYGFHICISINEEVVHGLPSERRLETGDLVSLDVGVAYRGFIGDNATTVAVGSCSPEDSRLLEATERSLLEGLAQALPGNRVGDISAAVQRCLEDASLSVVREYSGHGVGRTLHEEPQVPNFTSGRPTPRLEPGMTLAIEPMAAQGTARVRCLEDGWTVVTGDGRRSAHFEHTVLVTEGEPEVLTCPENVPSEAAGAGRK